MRDFFLRIISWKGAPFSSGEASVLMGGGGGGGGGGLGGVGGGGGGVGRGLEKNRRMGEHPPCPTMGNPYTYVMLRYIRC